jgi:hypothetical protein
MACRMQPLCNAPTHAAIKEAVEEAKAAQRL